MKEKSNTRVIKVVPLRTHTIKQNEILIQLIEGEEREVPERFKQTLITEKVIKDG